MMFDTLARLVEKYPEMIDAMTRDKSFDIISRAKLFTLDKTSPELMKMGEWIYNFTPDLFFLPFPIIAIEDPDSCILLIDTLDNQSGLESNRKWIECAHYKDTGLQNLGHGKVVVVSTGEISNITSHQEKESGHFWNGLFACRGGIVFEDDEFVGTILGSDMPEDMTRSQGRNVLTAFEEVIYFNQPDRFVLEVSNTRSRQPKPNRILRSHDRPQYTLIRPNEARRRMNLPPLSAGGHVAPHERRRHFRTLHSDRFTHKKGQTIIIAATWIGPSESVVENKRYRILTET